MRTYSTGSNKTYSRDFAEYYDRLNTHKDYVSEAAKLAQFIRQHVKSARPRILDVGCGTGQHAMFLADKGYDITAIDISSDMVEVAKRKTNNVQFVCADVADLDQFGFEFSYSLFNVINCLSSIEELISFFKGVALHLNNGATFLLECWNPIAVIAVPPTIVKRVYEFEVEKIVRKVSPTPDFLRQRLDLEYSIEVYRNDAPDKKVKNFSVVHSLVLFTPQEVDYCLTQAGFCNVKVYTALPELATATASDRMLALVCEKSS